MTISSIAYVVSEMHRDCNTRGLSHRYTTTARWYNRESHSPVWRREKKERSRGVQGEYTSPCTYKALASVYITYVVQFHDVSLQFRRRIFHHYPTVFLSPRLLHTTFVLPSSTLSISLSFSLVSVHYLSSPPPPVLRLQGWRTTLWTKTNWKYLLAKYSRGTSFDLAEYIGRQRYIRSYRLVIKYPLLRTHDLPRWLLRPFAPRADYQIRGDTCRIMWRSRIMYNLQFFK